MFCLSEYVAVGLLVVPQELGNILIKERQQYTFTLHDIFVTMKNVFRDWNLLSVLNKNYLLEYIYIKSLKIYGLLSWTNEGCMFQIDIFLVVRLWYHVRQSLYPKILNYNEMSFTPEKQS